MWQNRRPGVYIQRWETSLNKLTWLEKVTFPSSLLSTFLLPFLSQLHSLSIASHYSHYGLPCILSEMYMLHRQDFSESNIQPENNSIFIFKKDDHKHNYTLFRTAFSWLRNRVQYKEGFSSILPSLGNLKEAPILVFDQATDWLVSRQISVDREKMRSKYHQCQP